MLRCITSAIRAFREAIASRWAVIRREYIVEQYIRSGAVFGEALSYLHMGECVGFQGMKERFAKLERLYADLGYRTIPLEDFLEYGGYGKAIDHLVRVKRAEGEEPILHAITFQQRYEQGILPGLDVPHEGEPTNPPSCPNIDGIPDKGRKRLRRKGCDDKRCRRDQDPPAS